MKSYVNQCLPTPIESSKQFSIEIIIKKWMEVINE